MAGPYRCTDMLVKIDGSTVGVVTGMEINVTYEGGTVDHVYGQNTGYISHGGKRGTFTLQRWFMTDSDTDLLFDLFDQRLAFALTGEIDGVANSTIGLSNCRANSWRPMLGDANTVVGEEVSGEAVDWNLTTV